jgi:hypothetical protein
LYGTLFSQVTKIVRQREGCGWRACCGTGEDEEDEELEDDEDEEDEALEECSCWAA